jgi:hypothetical protein
MSKTSKRKTARTAHHFFRAKSFKFKILAVSSCDPFLRKLPSLLARLALYTQRGLIRLVLSKIRTSAKMNDKSQRGLGVMRVMMSI